MAQGGVITVIGSLIVDFRVRIARRPEAGETLPVLESGIYAGGKGLNQAVGVRRLGGRVRLIGRVGEDLFGRFITDALRREKIGLDGIARDPAEPTGTALPITEGDVQYILHGPGANQTLVPEEVAARLEAWGPTPFLLMQGEVNREANLVAALWAKEHGTALILDPAPAEGISEDLVGLADYLTPNAVELGQLAQSRAPESVDEAAAMADLVFSRYPQLFAVVATLGPWGAYAATRQGHFRVPAPKVPVVDPTAAGDVFNAAMAEALLRGAPIREAVARGVEAGSYACQIAGALPSIPTAEALAGARP